jgi:hypothetical protein
VHGAAQDHPFAMKFDVSDAAIGAAVMCRETDRQ